MGDQEIYLKDSLNLGIHISNVGGDIVVNAHFESSYLGLKDTLNEIKKGCFVDI